MSSSVPPGLTLPGGAVTWGHCAQLRCTWTFLWRSACAGPLSGGSTPASIAAMLRRWSGSELLCCPLVASDTAPDQGRSPEIESTHPEEWSGTRLGTLQLWAGSEHPCWSVCALPNAWMIWLAREHPLEPAAPDCTLPLIAMSAGRHPHKRRPCAGLMPCLCQSVTRKAFGSSTGLPPPRSLQILSATWATHTATRRCPTMPTYCSRVLLSRHGGIRAARLQSSRV